MIYWNESLVTGYLEYYNELKEFNVEPWQVAEMNPDEGEFGVSLYRTPFEMSAILNADFDLAISKLPFYQQKIIKRDILNHVNSDWEDNVDAVMAVNSLRDILTAWDELEKGMT